MKIFNCVTYGGPIKNYAPTTPSADDVCSFFSIIFVFFCTNAVSAANDLQHRI
jgi:hypothetical protein